MIDEKWEPTNAALMIVDTQTVCGHIGIDPLGDTWIEAMAVIHLWKGRPGKIPILRSRGECDGEPREIWFVSLDWLIELYPDNGILCAARDGLRERIRQAGFADGSRED